jgi:hypothetical protein
MCVWAGLHARTAACRWCTVCSPPSPRPLLNRAYATSDPAEPTECTASACAAGELHGSGGTGKAALGVARGCASAAPAAASPNGHGPARLSEPNAAPGGAETWGLTPASLPRRHNTCSPGPWPCPGGGVPPLGAGSASPRCHRIPPAGCAICGEEDSSGHRDGVTAGGCGSWGVNDRAGPLSSKRRSLACGRGPGACAAVVELPGPFSPLAGWSRPTAAEGAGAAAGLTSGRAGAPGSRCRSFCQTLSVVLAWPGAGCAATGFCAAALSPLDTAVAVAATPAAKATPTATGVKSCAGKIGKPASSASSLAAPKARMAAAPTAAAASVELCRAAEARASSSAASPGPAGGCTAAASELGGRPNTARHAAAVTSSGSPSASDSGCAASSCCPRCESAGCSGPETAPLLRSSRGAAASGLAPDSSSWLTVPAVGSEPRCCSADGVTRLLSGSGAGRGRPASDSRNQRRVALSASRTEGTEPQTPLPTVESAVGTAGTL